MNVSGLRIHSAPFAGGSVSAYRAARRELRRQAAEMLGVPIQRVRIAPGRVSLQRHWNGRWARWSQDIADQQETYLRHCDTDTRFRLSLLL